MSNPNPDNTKKGHKVFKIDDIEIVYDYTLKIFKPVEITLQNLRLTRIRDFLMVVSIIEAYLQNQLLTNSDVEVMYKNFFYRIEQHNNNELVLFLKKDNNKEIELLRTNKLKARFYLKILKTFESRLNLPELSDLNLKNFQKKTWKSLKKRYNK